MKDDFNVSFVLNTEFIVMSDNFDKTEVIMKNL